MSDAKSSGLTTGVSMALAALSAEQRAYVEKVFKKYDADNSGTVELEELKPMLTEMKIFKNQFSMDFYAKEVMTDLDKDKSGTIDLGEFAGIYRKYANLPKLPASFDALDKMQKEAVYKAFSKADTDHSGSVESKELIPVLIDVLEISEEAVKNGEYEEVFEDVFKDLDYDKDGKVSLDEFVAIYKKFRVKLPNAFQTLTDEEKKTVWKHFRAMDKDGSGEVDLNELTPVLFHMFKVSAEKQKSPQIQKVCKEIFADLDKDKSGTIDIDEFIGLYKKFNLRIK